MENIFTTELRIETLHASWTRNCIILVSLAIALRSFNKKNLKKLSDLLCILSIFIILYNFINLQQIKYEKNKNKLYSLYVINCFLLFIALGIYFKLS